MLGVQGFMSQDDEGTCENHDVNVAAVSVSKRRRQRETRGIDEVGGSVGSQIVDYGLSLDFTWGKRGNRR